jgi:hypothetical protein
MFFFSRLKPNKQHKQTYSNEGNSYRLLFLPGHHPEALSITNQYQRISLQSSC